MSTENKAEDRHQEPEKLGYTQSKLIKFNYTWVIKNFKAEAEKNFKSPIFSPGCNGKLKFYLRFQRNRVRASTYDRLLYLRLLPCDMFDISVNYRASLLNGNGDAVFIVTGQPTRQRVSATEETEYPTNIPRVYSESDMMSGNYKLLPGGHLTIFYEIQLVIHEFNVTVSSAVIKAPECQLYGDMGNLLENQNFTDITIEVCELKLPAHKAILSARSRVFSAMFKNEMMEKQENRVKVKDVEPEVMKELLRYIYTGQVPLIETIADKLLIAAEKYELERLKLMCAETLRTKLTIGNVTDTLILANIHNVDQLKLHAIDYIVLNAAEVMETVNFKAMINSHPSMIVDILRVATKRKSPEPDSTFMLDFLD